MPPALLSFSRFHHPHTSIYFPPYCSSVIRYVNKQGGDGNYFTTWGGGGRGGRVLDATFGLLSADSAAAGGLFEDKGASSFGAAPPPVSPGYRSRSHTALFILYRASSIEYIQDGVVMTLTLHPPRVELGFCRIV
jgi:hypothetical protein